MIHSAETEIRSGTALPFRKHLVTALQILLVLLLLCTPLVVWELTGIPKHAIKQAFAELLTALLLIVWILKMNETGQWRVRVSALTVAIGLFLITQALSMSTAANRGLSLHSMRLVAFPALLYLVARNTMKGEEAVRRCLIAMAVSAFVVSAYGLLQSAGNDFMGWCTDGVPCVLAPSSFASAAAAADFLVIALPVVAALIFYARSRVGKLIATAAALLILLHLRLTARAEAFVALELGIIGTFLVVWLARRASVTKNASGTRRFASRRLIAAALTLLAVVGVAHALTLLRSRSATLSEAQTTLINEQVLRKAACECAARMAIAYPTLGTGSGSYGIESPPFWNEVQQRWFAHSPETEATVENEYLRTAAESGAPGLAALVLIISLSWAYFFAGCRRATAGRTVYLAMGVGGSLIAGAVNAFFSESFHEPAVLFAYFFLLAAIEVTARGDNDQQTGSVDTSGIRKRPVVYYLVWAAVILVTPLAVLFVGRQLAYYHYLHACNQAIADERFDDAKREYAAACRIRQWAWEPHMLRAGSLAEQGKAERATMLYAKVLELHPNHVVALTHAGTGLLERGMPVEAITLLEKAVDFNPYVSAIRYALGEAYVAREERAAALEQFNAAEKHGYPERDHLYFNQYKCLYKLGRYALSDERLEALLRRKPHDPGLLYDVARLELERDHTSRAFELLDRALSLSERYPPEPDVLAGIHYELAMLHLTARKDVATALHHASRVKQIYPKHSKIKRLLVGLAIAVQSDRVRAANADVLPQFLYSVGTSFSRSPRPVDPTPFLEEAASLAGEKLPAIARDAHVRLAEHKLKLGYLNEALAELEAAEHVDPFDHNVFRVRGGVYVAMFEPDEARHAYQHALHIMPSDEQSRAKLLQLEGLEEI